MSFELKGPDIHEDVKQLQVKVEELEKRIEGLYDILEELLKKID